MKHVLFLVLISSLGCKPEDDQRKNNIGAASTIKYYNDDSNLNGASVFVNTGALAAGSSLLIEEGEQILSNELLADLELNEQGLVTASKSALLVSQTNQVNPIGSLVITIPLNGSNLTTMNYAVVYEVHDYANGTRL